MDLAILKKKLSSYKSDKGYLRNVPDDILYDILLSWENWSGPSPEFYRSLGFTYKQMAGLIGKAKKLKREGNFGTGDFKQIHVEPILGNESELQPCTGIEVVWSGDKIIRFQEVDRLLEFLKKAV